MWDSLEFLETWGWWLRLQDPETQVISFPTLPTSCQLSLECCHSSPKGGLGGSRLRNLITQLIHPDQTGLLLGRCSAYGVRKLLICQFWLLTEGRGLGCWEVGKLLAHLPCSFGPVAL